MLNGSLLKKSSDLLEQVLGLIEGPERPLHLPLWRRSCRCVRRVLLPDKQPFILQSAFAFITAFVLAPMKGGAIAFIVGLLAYELFIYAICEGHTSGFWSFSSRLMIVAWSVVGYIAGRLLVQI